MNKSGHIENSKGSRQCWLQGDQNVQERKSFGSLQFGLIVKNVYIVIMIGILNSNLTK